ncbi:MAG: DNA polymerase IV, partial [Desulfofundulus sp.]
DRVAERVRMGGYAGKTVVLSLKDANFAYLSRMKTLRTHTDLAADVYRAAVEILERHWPEGWPVRMVGVALAGLVPKPPEQLTLFGDREKLSRVERSCDYIRSRFGEKAIFRASSLTGAGVRYAG